MRYFVETLGVLLAGAGLFIFGWLLLGRLLAPVGMGTVAVLPARGDGGRLEQEVRGLLWLRWSGLARPAIVVADCGLDEDGRALAAALQRRTPEILICPAGQLGALLTGGDLPS